MRILYICDRKKCENCNTECGHTTDVTHAANFKSSICDGSDFAEDYWENENRTITLPTKPNQNFGEITCRDSFNF